MLPGPVVITNIWPMPTITKNAEKLSEPDNSEPAPWPPVKAMVAIQISKAARNDHTQGLPMTVASNGTRFIVGEPQDG